MTRTDDILASGLGQAEIATLLGNAEPRRRANLSVSINLSAGMFFMVLGRAPLGTSFFWPIVACVVAGMVWTLSNRLWRDIALASVAQALGERWGQSHFASGWGIVGIEKWFADLFSSEGQRFTAWESRGRHRDIDYRLNEATIWRRRRNQKRSQIFHLMQIEIAVPVPFAGSVEIRPRSGLAPQVGDFFRQISGEEEQRQTIDPRFDAAFDTFASANASVEKLMTPAFQKAMLELSARNRQSYLSGRFEQGWFSLRLPIPHVVFASARLLTPMHALIEDVDTLWWDLTIPHRLIESLMGDHTGPLR